MSDLYTQPSATLRQLSGPDISGQPILSVLAKRTYQLDANGRWYLPEQLPLVEDLILDEAPSPGGPPVILHDSDLYLFKLRTDVVVLGHAYAKPGERSFTAGIAVGSQVKSLLVFGDRHCSIASNGQLRFSDPALCERIPLRYDRAYGGRDRFAEQAQGNPFTPLQPYMKQVDLDQASPFVYPRNACGVGYLIEARPEAVEGLVLPNFEDPEQPLRPSTLALGNCERWPEMPLPWCTSWVDPASFPRLACLGGIAGHEPLGQPFTEARRGFLPPEVFVTTNAAGQPKPIEERYSPHFANGASLGLAVPPMRGDEELLLVRMHPQLERFHCRLPAQVPQIWTDGREGKLVETRPMLHSVVVEPDEARLSVVWRGSAASRRLYTPDELQSMPLLVRW